MSKRFFSKNRNLGTFQVAFITCVLASHIHLIVQHVQSMVERMDGPLFDGEVRYFDTCYVHGIEDVSPNVL
ncbi:MAG: hypothetical protein MJA29_05950 [Candidatus Omnitrophica bacterium]|nr:hypothetical protein [Candidatus Omnitrophota bacterium]